MTPMSRVVAACLIGLSTIAIAACGDDEKFALHRVPLASGVQVREQRYDCIEPTLCARYVILEGQAAESAGELLGREAAALRQGGWTVVRDGGAYPTVDATSPDRRSYLTLSTAAATVREFSRRGVHWNDDLNARLHSLAGSGAPALAGTLGPPG